MKILIAGGAGFIGSNLCELLLQKVNEVMVVDNLVTGSKRNILPFAKNPNFQFLQLDITKKIDYKGKIDRIYHLASPASPPRYRKFPIQTALANSLGTYNLLELAKKNQAKFLFASTSEVYGEPKVHPQTEDYRGNVNTLGPRACYDESKRLGEALTMEYLRTFGVDVRLVRIFNTYGPNMEIDDGRVVSNFIVQCLRNNPLTVYGDGNQTRSFTYVDDMTRALFLSMESKNTKGQVINLGSTREESVKNIAEIIARLTNSKPLLKFFPLPQDDPTRRQPNINKARKLISWEPKISLEQGLVKTIEYFQQILR